MWERVKIANSTSRPKLPEDAVRVSIGLIELLFYVVLRPPIVSIQEIGIQFGLHGVAEPAIG
jgi:hypothetical protein